jgi:hypothetical protein
MDKGPSETSFKNGIRGMASKFETLKKELASLVARGDLLYYSIANEFGKVPDTFKKDLEKHGIKLPDFTMNTTRGTPRHYEW